MFINLAAALSLAFASGYSTSCYVTDADTFCPMVREAPDNLVPRDAVFVTITSNDKADLRTARDSELIATLQSSTQTLDLRPLIEYVNATTLRLNVGRLRALLEDPRADYELSLRGFRFDQEEEFFLGNISRLRFQPKSEPEFTTSAPARPFITNAPTISALSIAHPKPATVDSEVKQLPDHRQRGQNSLTTLFPVHDLIAGGSGFLDDRFNPYARYPGQFKIGYRVQAENTRDLELTKIEVQLFDESGWLPLSQSLAFDRSQLQNFKGNGNALSFDLVIDTRFLRIDPSRVSERAQLRLTPHFEQFGIPVAGLPLSKTITPSYNLAEMRSAGCLAYSIPYSAWGTAKLWWLVERFKTVAGYPMYCNDGSYPFGGAFRLPGGRQVHAGHRQGTALDIRYFSADPETYDRHHAMAREEDVRAVFRYAKSKICSPAAAAATATANGCLTAQELELCLNGSSYDLRCGQPPLEASARLAQWAYLNREALTRIKADADFLKLEVIVSSGNLSRLTRQMRKESAFISRWQHHILKNGALPLSTADVHLWYEGRRLEPVRLAFLLDYPGHLHHMHLYLNGKAAEGQSD